MESPPRAVERVPMRVAWVETDASGRIHNTAPLRWAEAAEHSLMRRLGLGGVHGYPRRHVEATFHAPMAFGDEFDFVFEVERLGTTSVAYAWRAERGGVLCVEGRTVAVHVDADGRPAALPADFRAALA